MPQSGVTYSCQSVLTRKSPIYITSPPLGAFHSLEQVAKSRGPQLVCLKPTNYATTCPQDGMGVLRHEKHRCPPFHSIHRAQRNLVTPLSRSHPGPFNSSPNILSCSVTSTIRIHSSLLIIYLNLSCSQCWCSRCALTVSPIVLPPHLCTFQSSLPFFLFFHVYANPIHSFRPHPNPTSSSTTSKQQYIPVLNSSRTLLSIFVTCLSFSRLIYLVNTCTISRFASIS